MRKIAVLLSITVALVTFGIVPVQGKKQMIREDGVGGKAVAAEENANDIVDNGAGPGTDFEDDGQRFAIRYVQQQDESATSAAESTKTPKPSKLHNAKLLNRLGMKRVRTTGNGGNSHHRKRLASQSRSKYATSVDGGGGGGGGGKSSSDSQMFIVKLPPHAHFYGDGSASAVHHRPQQHPQSVHSPQQQHVAAVGYKNFNTVPVGFVSNGKPAKVYHWNLPTVKHALKYKNGGSGDVAQQMYLQQYTDEFDLPSSLVGGGGKVVMPRRTLYYKPKSAAKPVKKSYVNNGKPNGFYVVGKNGAAGPSQFHKIIKTYYGAGDD